MKIILNTLSALSLLILFVSASPDDRPFDEPYRAQFHFTPEANSQKQAESLLYFEEEYHLFFQQYPLGNDSTEMTWGHAVSRDLLYWEQLDEIIPEKENCEEWSGTAVVDNNDVSGLKDGELGTILFFYIGDECDMQMVFSNDKGRSWSKYDGSLNISVENGACEPSVFWYEPSQKYIMMLCQNTEENEDDQGISFFSSEDLLNWQFESQFPGEFYSPELVEMPVDRRSDEKRWVLINGDGDYYIGDFDGEKYTAETGMLRNEYGINYYSTQVFDNSQNDGNIVQISWLRGGSYPDMPFTGQMTFPTNLSLYTDIEGIRLKREPIAEIDLLHEKGLIIENKTQFPGLNENLMKKAKGDCLHIIGTFDPKTANNFGFVVRNSKKRDGAEIYYDATKNILNCLGNQAVLVPEDGKIKLEILIDRTSIEIFGNDGRVVMSLCYSTIPNADDIIFFNNGGEVLVEKLEVFPMKSVYQTE